MLDGAPAATAVPASLEVAEPAAPAATLPLLAALELPAPVVAPLVVAVPVAADVDPALVDPDRVALEPGVPAEPAPGVPDEDEPPGAAEEFGAAFDALALGFEVGDAELEDGFGAGFEVVVGVGVGLGVLPELMAGGLIPGWAPAPKLKATAVPGCGSQPATPTWL